MFEKWQYVQKRHNKYGLRVPVPFELQHVIGKKEVTRSLGTGEVAEAKRRYGSKLAEINEQFDAARLSIRPEEPAPLSVEMAQALTRDYFQERIFRAEEEAHAAVNALGLSPEAVHEICREIEINTAQDLQEYHALGYASAHWDAGRILKDNGFPTVAIQSIRSTASRGTRVMPTKPHVDQTSEGYEVLLRSVHAARIELCERVLAIMRGERYCNSSSIFGFEPRFTVNTSEIRPIVQATNIGRKPIALRDLLERFLAAHPSKSSRWMLDIRTAFKPLIQLKGVATDANALTKQDFRDILAFIRKMPTQIGNNKKRWAGKSLVEIVNEAASDDVYEDAFLHSTTVNKYMSRISQVMSWAEDEPLIEKNYARGIRVHPDETDDDDFKRLPFSNDELNSLFSTDEFANPNPDAPSVYWAVLIGLLQGMRCEEILQLKAEDIQADPENILFIDIHKRNGNHLKNDNSKRQIPVHKKLMSFGFEGLVSAAKNRSDTSLFPDITRGSEGKFTPAFSRRFSRFLERQNIKKDGLSFHSLRHTFRDEARICSVPDDRACALGGWVYGSGVHTSYGAGLPIYVKHEALQKMTYDRVDFKKITIIDWRSHR